MPLRTRIARTVAGTLILILALVSVGLTSPADGPLAIRIRTAFLSIDVEIKLGTLRARYSWSASPPLAPTTKTTDPSL